MPWLKTSLISSYSLLCIPEAITDNSTWQYIKAQHAVKWDLLLSSSIMLPCSSYCNLLKKKDARSHLNNARFLLSAYLHCRYTALKSLPVSLCTWGQWARGVHSHQKALLCHALLKKTEKAKMDSAPQCLQSRQRLCRKCVNPSEKYQFVPWLTDGCQSTMWSLWRTKQNTGKGPFRTLLHLSYCKQNPMSCFSVIWYLKQPSHEAEKCVTASFRLQLQLFHTEIKIISSHFPLKIDGS